MLKVNIIKLSLVFLSTVIVGCSTVTTYPGPERSKNEIVIIKSIHSFFPPFVQFKVDNVKPTIYGRQIHVPPGNHAVTAWLLSQDHSGSAQTSSESNFSLETKAGESYLIYYGNAGGNHIIIIKEETSKKIYYPSN